MNKMLPLTGGSLPYAKRTKTSDVTDFINSPSLQLGRQDGQNYLSMDSDIVNF